ncbi:MAG: hypothetical protein ACREA4_06000, partial [Nitrososphaera sp.]
IKDLQEERRHRQAAEEQLREHKEQLQSLSSLRDELESWRKKQKLSMASPEEQAEAEYDADPIGYLKKRITDHDKVITQEAYKRTTETRAREEADHLARETSSKVDEFRRTQPDYDHAFQYLVGQWTDEFKAMGLAPSEITTALDNQAMSIMRYANDRRSNAAEMLYRIAGSRGYKPGTDDLGGLSSSRIDDNLAASHRRLSRGTDEFERLKSIENMSDSEFDKLWTRMAESDKNRGR